MEWASKQAAFASDWAEQVLAGPDFLVRQLRLHANLIAAPLAALSTHPLFAEGDREFDLLIVDHAQHVSESEFKSVARRCRRWVLLGESSSMERASADPQPAVEKSHHARLQLEGRRTRPPDPGFLQRLWLRLHCNPRDLPYSWQREADSRLCCRLRKLTLQQRGWIERERVADFPDIELRIVAPPRGAPDGADSFLAEVVFPAHMSVLEAKSYVFRELEEVPVRAGAGQVQWRESPDRLELVLSDEGQAVESVTSISLAQGVREIVATSVNGDAPSCDAWVTRAVEFDRAAGWDRDRAEAWAARHLGLRDLGRTAILESPQGFAPGLAPFLSDVLLGGGYRIFGASASSRLAPVEFVAVPPLPRGLGRGQQRRPRLPSGAGLELDLGDPRVRDRLPSESGARLRETSGFVNYPEAQAVVRALKRLASERAGIQSVAKMGTVPPSSGGQRRLLLHELSNGAVGSPLPVGVVALYPAQAQLIRVLLEPVTELLTAAGLDVRVGEPEGFREREFAIVLVSLTRSHTHRATSFGTGPSAIVAALTRGRSRLILIGDPGTLARRAHWQAALDHLDEPASAREREIIARLVPYLHGEGRYQHLFHLRHDNPKTGAVGGRGGSVQGAAARESSSA
jgi:hypothetical protein